MFDILQQQLIRIVAQQGLEPVARLRVLWPVLLPSRISSRTLLESIRHQRLQILAEAPALIQELQLFSRSLLSKIVSLGVLPEYPNLCGINARLGNVPHAPTRRKSQRTSLLPTPDQPVTGKLREAIDAIDDPELRIRLERIARKRKEEPKVKAPRSRFPFTNDFENLS